MTTFLYYLTPQTGHVFPHVPTWQELRRRGHRVVVRCGPDHVAMLHELGITAAAVSPGIVARTQDDWRARSPIGALRRSMRTFLDRSALEVEDLRAAIVAESPDVLVVDALCWGAGSFAETTGLPWAWSAPFPLAIESRELPPPGLGLAPGSGAGPFGAVRDSALRATARLVWRPTLAELNQLRARLGAPTVSSMNELWSAHAPLTLIHMAEPLEYPRTDWPPTVRLVGPGVWSPPAQAPPWLDDLPAPLVLVSCSTERQRDDRLAKVALEALADLEVSVVVTTTTASDIDTWAVPANARIERFIAHGALMNRAVCVVCAGGMGTTHTALTAGVPVVAVPFGRDQPEVARRVEVAGVGVRLPASRLNPTRLRAAVVQAMTLTTRAAEVGAQLHAAGASHRAADALETLIRVAR